MVILSIILAIVLAGSLAYSLLILVAARQYLSASVPVQRNTPDGVAPPISVLKPLCGLEDELEKNIRSFVDQDYTSFEILFAVHRPDDPAVGVAERIKSEASDRVSMRLIVSGESPIPNAKSFSLQRLVQEARYDFLVMSDSDVRVTPDLLQRISGQFSDPRVGVITCPYRAVPGRSLWSRLEAVGMNTDFIGGVLVARMIEGMKFALGPTVAVRREVLDAMGGFAYLRDFLAEDFEMGRRAAELGHTVLLSSFVIEHHIGSQNLTQNLQHRLRWARSTRRSRPAGYWGEIFTHPLPWALLLWAVYPATWPILLLTVILRAGAANMTASGVLKAP
ncbi:MAG TPA: glycosyltransferase, partial [Acidobacteriota bacterium]|nr:glycosyltransferase [Acidobacteriota bacterium]